MENTGLGHLQTGALLSPLVDYPSSCTYPCLKLFSRLTDLNLKVRHPRCVRAVIQNIVCIISIYTVIKHNNVSDRSGM